MKKVIVFGATGATGRHVVRELVAQGHTVTAFARNPGKVNTHADAVAICQGDARDPKAVAQAIQGQDAVMSAFGPRSLKKDDLQETFLRNVVRGMEAAGVKRLIDLSAWGAGDSYDHASISFKLMHHTILRHMYADKNRGEALIFASDLSYTLIRPGRLTNQPARGNVKASLSAGGLSRAIARADVAAFMVAQLSSSKWERQAPLIGC